MVDGETSIDVCAHVFMRYRCFSLRDLIPHSTPVDRYGDFDLGEEHHCARNAVVGFQRRHRNVCMWEDGLDVSVSVPHTKE